MSWEDLPSRVRRVREKWAVTVGKNGVMVWCPTNYRPPKECCRTQLGKGDHSGLIKLIPSDTGRKFMARGPNKDVYCLRFSTLPGVPEALEITAVDHRVDPTDDSISFRLPWRVPGAPFQAVGARVG